MENKTCNTRLREIQIRAHAYALCERVSERERELHPIYMLSIVLEINILFRVAYTYNFATILTLRRGNTCHVIHFILLANQLNKAKKPFSMSRQPYREISRWMKSLAAIIYSSFFILGEHLSDFFHPLPLCENRYAMSMLARSTCSDRSPLTDWYIKRRYALWVLLLYCRRGEQRLKIAAFIFYGSGDTLCQGVRFVI
jgi:hypothetical protein